MTISFLLEWGRRVVEIDRFMTDEGGRISEKIAALRQYERTLWRHRKGGLYELTIFAVREIDREIDVLYYDIANDIHYTRPARDFFDGRFQFEGRNAALTPYRGAKNGLNRR